MRTILILEDDPHQSRLMERLLERAGCYNILIEHSGEGGLQTAMVSEPDLILLDMGLPDMDGQTVAGLIKGSSLLSDIPLVVVTAWPEDTAAAIARAYGCEGYISKPINAREFADQVATYFKPESAE